MAAGLRGKALADLRKRLGIGQRHLGLLLGGVRQPTISDIENERLGGMPRGFSARAQVAMYGLKARQQAVAGAELSGEPWACFRGCGCSRDKGRTDVV